MYEDFQNASFAHLLEQAEDYLFQYSCTNRPQEAYGVGVLPVNSTACVAASREGGVAFNFASKAVQGMMVYELPDAEAVIEELMQRMMLVENYRKAGEQVGLRLSMETETFLDSLRGMSALDAGEAVDFALSSVAPFFKAPAPTR